MKPEPLVRRQTALMRCSTLTIHLAQQLQYEAAFAGKVLRALYKLPASVRNTVGRRGLHLAGSLGTLRDCDIPGSVSISGSTGKPPLWP